MAQIKLVINQQPTVSTTLTKPDIETTTNINQGAPVSAGIDKDMVYRQNTPQSEWNINHDLDKFPSVTIVDSANEVVIGEVQYIDENNLTIKFSGAFSGKAFLN